MKNFLFLFAALASGCATTQDIIEKQCMFSSSPTKSSMAKGPIALILKSSVGGNSMSWGEVLLDEVKVDKQSNHWLGTGQSGTVKISFIKNYVTVKNELSGVIGHYSCDNSDVKS